MDAMSIKREDLDAGRIDFGDVTGGKRIPLTHPGEILLDDFLPHRAGSSPTRRLRCDGGLRRASARLS